MENDASQLASRLNSKCKNATFPAKKPFQETIPNLFMDIMQKVDMRSVDGDSTCPGGFGQHVDGMFPDFDARVSGILDVDL